MPEKEATFHQHPSNIHDQVYGLKLVAGDVLEPTDVYNSSNGFWEQCTCPGVPLQGDGATTIWIRPLEQPAGAIYYEPRPGSPRPLPTAAQAAAIEAAKASLHAPEESENDESAES